MNDSTAVLRRTLVKSWFNQNTQLYILKGIHIMTIKQLYIITLLSLLFIGCNRSGIETTENEKKAAITKSDSQVLKSDTNGFIKTLEGKHAIFDLAVNNKTLYLAEGDGGLEVVSLDTNYTLESKTDLTFEDFNAKTVSFSQDKKKLFVGDDAERIMIVDIQDENMPVLIGTSDKESIKNDTLSKTISYTYISKDEKHIEEVTLNNPSIKDDSHFATEAITLNIDFKDENSNALTIMSKERDITSLALNDDRDILFVATGSKGLLVYNLDMLMENQRR